MIIEQLPLYIGNHSEQPNCDLEVFDKYTGQIAARVAMADADMIDKAIEMAAQATPRMAALKPYQRQMILLNCVEQFKKRFDELSTALCIEAGKSIKDAEGEAENLPILKKLFLVRGIMIDNPEGFKP